MNVAGVLSRRFVTLILKIYPVFQQIQRKMLAYDW